MHPITSFYNMLTDTMLDIPSWWGLCGLKPVHAHWSLWNPFGSCLVFIFCVGLSHVLTHSLFHAVLANSGRHSHSFNKLRKKYIYTTSWSTLTDTAVFLKQRLTSGPLCVEMSASLQQLWSVTPRAILWASRAYYLCPSPLSLLPFQGLVDQSHKREVISVHL